MTKKEASRKVIKLRNLAEKNSSPDEASSARKEADRLAAMFGLTDEELSVGAKTAAFDDLLTELDSYVRDKQVPPVVFEVIEKMKKETKEEDKVKALGQFVGVVRVASLFFDVKGIKIIIDKVLAKHRVTI